MTDKRKVREARAMSCERLGDLAAAASPGAGAAPDARQWASIEAKLERWPWRPAIRHRWLRLAVGAAACACALGWLAARRTLSYRVEACAISADGSLRSLQNGVVAFADGTRIDLEPASRLRIKPLAFARGAELLLDDGEASLAVLRRPESRWAVVAGPFRVQVTGTRFSVRWSESKGRLRIAMAEGEVRVGGGPIPRDTALRAGQALEAEAGRFVVTDAATPPLPAAPPPTPASELGPGQEKKPTTGAPGSPDTRAPGTSPSPRREAVTVRRAAEPKRALPPAASDRAVTPALVLDENVPPVPPPPPSAPPPPPTAMPPSLPPAPKQAGPARARIAADGQLDGAVSGFAWVEGGQGTVFSQPPNQPPDRSRLHATDGQLCAHGRLAAWACVNEGTPHLRCNWDRNWGAAIGFYVKREQTAWGAEAASAIAIDFRGRSASYRLTTHRQGDPAHQVYCIENYKSGRVVKPSQFKSRCWDDAGDTLSDFQDVDWFGLQSLAGLDYVAFRYCVTGIATHVLPD